MNSSSFHIFHYTSFILKCLKKIKILYLKTQSVVFSYKDRSLMIRDVWLNLQNSEKNPA